MSRNANAKVFMVDDSEEIREVLWLFLHRLGHEVVLEAFTLESALEKIREVRKKKVNVAIVDGSLRAGVYSSQDGENVALAIRKEAPEVKIIALSGQEVSFGDVNLRKPVSLDVLEKAIEEVLT